MYCGMRAPKTYAKPLQRRKTDLCFGSLYPVGPKSNRQSCHFLTIKAVLITAAKNCRTPSIYRLAPSAKAKGATEELAPEAEKRADAGGARDEGEGVREESGKRWIR